MSVSPRTLSVLVDLSGTLHIEDTAIPGAIAALQKLRGLKSSSALSSPISIKFVTNTTKESRNYLYDRLVNKIGFSLEKSEIFTSLNAARSLIDREQLRPLLLLEDVAMEDFEGVDTTPPLNAVVVGLAPSKFDFPSLNEAFKLLLEKRAKLIGIHKGRYYRRSDGLALGPGPFVVALEYAGETTAQVVGKPEKAFFLNALDSIGGDPQRVFMIGDDVRDDIDGAQKAGIKGILVKTGKYREGDESKIDPKPWAVVDDFRAAVDMLEQFMTDN